MYNNLPGGNSANPAATAFNSMYAVPLELETNTFNLMKGFFEAKGFDKTSAETIAVTFIRQAKLDGYNPLEIINTLKTFDQVKLNSAVIDVLNFNRFKSSYLGNSTGLRPFEPVARNVVA
jgi:hypothetical protein